MQEQLRKLAAAIRAQADETQQRKLVKCAQAAQALLALELLKRKIEG